MKWRLNVMYNVKKPWNVVGKLKEMVMAPQHGTAARKGFTLIEILVVITIISLLAAILFPVFARAREKARQASCMSNLKQIGVAAAMYAQDYDEMYLPATPGGCDFGSNRTSCFTWQNLAFPYVKNTQLFMCPSGPSPSKIDYNPWPYPGASVAYSSYTYNAITTSVWPSGYSSLYTGFYKANGPLSLAAVQSPATKIFILDAAGGATYSEPRVADYRSQSDSFSGATPSTYEGGSTYTRVSARHSGGFNALYADGHVKWKKFGSTTVADWAIQVP
jgi:prepilin-type N-terminal cleavage/methylation domain-containing protein/prepilin-type processing-associated H-X9-DG protein